MTTAQYTFLPWLRRGIVSLASAQSVEPTERLSVALCRKFPKTGILSSQAIDFPILGFRILRQKCKFATEPLADQQRVIAHLLTVDSEQRLAQALLHLAHQLGQHDPRSIRIVPKISHAELAEMVGTTRRRISTFMKHFRDLGLIELTTDHRLIIKQQRLTVYVERVHSFDGPNRCPTQQIFLIMSNIGQTSLQRCAILRFQCMQSAGLTRVVQGAGNRGSSAWGHGGRARFDLRERRRFRSG